MGQNARYLKLILGKPDKVRRDRSMITYVYEDQAEMATFQIEEQGGKISRITLNAANSVWAESWYQRTFGR